MDVMKTRILSLIDGSGKSDSFLEEAIGLPRGIIYKWRNNKNKNFKFYATDVASYFHVSTDYLLGNTDDPSPAGQKEGSEADPGSGVKYPPGYELLTPENRAKADSYLAFLLAEQQSGQT